MQAPQHGGGRTPRAEAGVPVVAAIDLGTNNCRLLVVEPLASGRFRVLESFARIVRLGEGVEQTGLLAETAMARTLAALKVCARRLSRYGDIPLRAIATAACRKAANADVLVERVRRETGIALEVVSEAEEARLAAVGCAPLVGQMFDGALVFDIGGGSTEVIWLKRTGSNVEAVFAVSMPLGVVGLTERGLSYDALLAEMRPQFAQAARAMTAAAGPFDLATHHLLGTSGTVTTLAGVALALARYDRRRIDGSWHDTKLLVATAARLIDVPRDARAAMPCVGPDRADLMAAGCAIFAALEAQWPCARLRVADRGLREGILRELACGTPAPASGEFSSGEF